MRRSHIDDGSNRITWRHRRKTTRDRLLTDRSQDETDVLLFLSTEAAAKALQTKEWADYHLIRLDLDLFIDGWLPNMIDDGLYCGLNWGQELVGLELDPKDAIADLEG
ncbi:DUF2750 domain-containing protein [uncultured Exiguobacterium sp.]|uniref:DUF2750 domain-containing protein n=1 Tax=uncultured Exiguobacterium sp. TaxID=202669 RepID=UPI00345A194C